MKTLAAFVSVAILAAPTLTWADVGDCLKNHYILGPKQGPAGESSPWTLVGNLRTARSGHSATLLADGRVLVAGGYTAQKDESGALLWGITATAEIYDPHTRTFRDAPSMNRARGGTASVRLADGRVMLVSQEAYIWKESVATAEIFDPVSGAWTLASPLGIAPLFQPTATLLPDGNVLVAGGVAFDETFPSARIYHPATDTWTDGGTMNVGRYGPTASLLPGGRVLLVGGIDDDFFVTSTRVAEIHDPATNDFVLAKPSRYSRAYHTAFTLADGRVAVFGGAASYSGNPSSFGGMLLSEAYDPSTDQWSDIPPITSQRIYHAAVMLRDGAILAAGGFTTFGAVPEQTWAALDTAEVRDSASCPSLTIAPMRAARMQHTATLLQDGSVLVVGGRGSDDTSIASAELLLVPVSP